MPQTRTRSERFERGLKTRREVLGSEYVDKSLAQADDFSWAMQELTTEWCWDGTWNRPGLDRRSRSILNLGMIAALGKANEFKIHVRGALNNGVTKDELKEIFIQIGTYCGVPAALESFRLAKEVFKEMNLD
ncbi:carboxymuconolactone decarboxylase family protein [Mesorhizobium silamurunense]|uniref:carboxymuconolactone decarboxylase family protein n=1 Tax=Mesorhizobium silamurunense TaxID=499528 RepID=UPI00177B19A5|nr:carboxymuconolactone decarboxylase family protein [Mesorhizobium silamurunense]